MLTSSQANSPSLKAKMLRGLSDTSRLAVLETLRARPRCVSEIVKLTELSQPNVSNHLACLRDCGLVAREQKGRFAFYRLADPRIAGLLREVERVVAFVEENLDACPNYDEGPHSPPRPLLSKYQHSRVATGR